MKKILIATMLLVFVLSPMSFARSNWGIGMTNVVSNILMMEIERYSAVPSGTLFYNFNNQHSLEGSLGVVRDAAEDGDTTDVTLFSLKYLFNFYTSKSLNTHVGVIGVWGQVKDQDGDSSTHTNIEAVFGGEAFLTDNLSLLIDLVASSLSNESSPTDPGDDNATGINISPTASFRLYL